MSKNSKALRNQLCESGNTLAEFAGSFASAYIRNEREVISDLKSALVMGSGFHKHAFGDVNDLHTRQALWDWYALKDATAEQI